MAEALHQRQSGRIVRRNRRGRGGGCRCPAAIAASASASLAPTPRPCQASTTSNATSAVSRAVRTYLAMPTARPERGIRGHDRLAAAAADVDEVLELRFAQARLRAVEPPPAGALGEPLEDLLHRAALTAGEPADRKGIGGDRGHVTVVDATGLPRIRVNRPSFGGHPYGPSRYRLGGGAGDPLPRLGARLVRRRLGRQRSAACHALLVDRRRRPPVASARLPDLRRGPRPPAHGRPLRPSRRTPAARRARGGIGAARPGEPSRPAAALARPSSSASATAGGRPGSSDDAVDLVAARPAQSALAAASPAHAPASSRSARSRVKRRSESPDWRAPSS